MKGEHDAALGAAQRGLDLDPNSKPLREEYARAKKDARRKDQVRAIKDDLHDLCAEMTPEERRWKAWWGGQGHPTCVNNTNLERYIPDCPLDVSYDAEVTQELHGPDNLPRLESDDEDDEDDHVFAAAAAVEKLDSVPEEDEDGSGGGWPAAEEAPVVVPPPSYVPPSPDVSQKSPLVETKEAEHHDMDCATDSEEESELGVV